ncbi:MAG: rod shape-determining protein RodA [Bdellovibrio sp.]|nr:MAG: rod shape-determining protein RodA [Bdellovibrio sp.]
MDFSLQVEERTLLKRIDWNFVVCILGLNSIGLINLYSATHGPYSTGVGPLFINQILWLAVGWSAFFVTTLIDYRLVLRLAPLIFVINLCAVLYVTFYGRVALGGQRWIDLGFFHYQPSETMKLALIAILARVLSPKSVDGPGMGLRELLLPLLLMIVPFIFVVEQPDMGTALLIALIGSSILFFMKIRRWIIAAVVGFAVVAAPVIWTYGLRDYQKNRIINFLNPSNDPRGSGYNSIQSKIAVGSGKLFGKGFRKGTQSQLEFLPERHTDFIFSVLSEEFGFFGSVLTLLVFAALFVIGVRIAATAKDKFGALLTLGVLCYLFWHMFINVGMVIGLLPIVGVPLPLLSYGGSSMLTTMMGLGLISSVAYRRYLF